VNERGVDDAIRARRSTPQAVRIAERTPMYFGAGGG